MVDQQKVAIVVGMLQHLSEERLEKVAGVIQKEITEQEFERTKRLAEMWATPWFQWSRMWFGRN